MSHPVICVYCKEKFDRDKIPAVQVSERRYAHEECANKYKLEETQEKKDLEELEKYIKKLFNEPYINARIRKQLRDYRKEYNYTYSGILKTLVYWYEIKGNTIENVNYGISIVPYVYQQACDYYYSLYLIQLSNKSKNIEKYKPKEKIIEIFPPEFKNIKKIRLFNLDEKED